MSIYAPLKFQTDAVNKLTICFLRMWKNGGRHLPLVFKAPTGSGKTFMTTNFINELNNRPDWDEDKAFIWITFSDDLAMQSRQKFEAYFENTIKNELLTVNDLNRGKLYKNDVLFLNWQKIVSRAAANRVLRRPEDESMHKETGVYFEDFIDNTHADGREIILIIDESHTHSSTHLSQQMIDYIDPRIILEVSATPENEPGIFDIEEGRAGAVYVRRDDVVDDGLIKEKIRIQTKEELDRFKGDDQDELLLKLGMIKREELRRQFQKLGKNINPLMLIQLPNDDSRLHDLGERKKEEIVLDYLRKHGVDIDSRVAMWFDGNRKNLDFISDNDDEVEFLLFKQAAGTGWDCPRAHVLVMFREIQSSTFYAQTVGRILRMAEPHSKEDYVNTPDLRTGFLYTNYRRDEIKDIETVTGNEPPSIFTGIRDKFKGELTDFSLESAFISRVDYGDLASSAKFQASLIKSFNEYFDIQYEDIADKLTEKLEVRGLETNPVIHNSLVANAVFDDFDLMSLEFKRKGRDVELVVSVNDIEKMFNFFCYKVLEEQTDEDARITNLARSWPRLKSAIRQWFIKSVYYEPRRFYRIFVNDMLKDAGSVFRPAITKALKDFRPILKKVLQDRKRKIEAANLPVFRFLDNYAFTKSYEPIEQKKCVLEKACFRKDYSGRENELRFVRYLEAQPDIKWWFKNGDSGKDYFALRYFNTTEQAERLFYPDWIVRFTDGRIGIFDTKSGITLNTEGRAKGLAERLIELGPDFVGGIVRYANGVYEYCSSADYDDITPSNNNWLPIRDI
jgi:type III restriction enzyme